jgi:hypothetical protein
MIDLDKALQGHLTAHYQACTEAAICEAKIVCEEDYHGNCAQFLSSFILPVCNLFQTLKKVNCIPGNLYRDSSLLSLFTQHWYSETSLNRPALGPKNMAGLKGWEVL